MVKTKTTKKKVETASYAPTAFIVPEKKGDYRVFIKVNGIVNDVFTDDVASTILALKPSLPKTNLTIRVTKGKVTRDRLLLLRDAKRLYSNEITMQMFIKNLLF